MDNKICIYAISKNEEQFVDAWMDSVSEADLVLVLDTGSTDNTVQKLRERGAIVYEKIITPWRFDVARNEAMKLIPEEYNILFSIDLDERLESGWSKPLREKWDDSKYDRAIYKYAWSHDESGNPGRIFHYDKIHSRDWIWKFPVHEALYHLTKDTIICDYTRSLNLFDEIYLHHYPDYSKSRSSYLPLLELREKEEPNDFCGLIYLAHEYFYQGLYHKSIKKLNYVLNNFGKIANATEKASCYLFMGDCYNNLNDNFRAKESYFKAIMIEDTYREPYLNLAKILLKEDKHELAYNILKTALKVTYRHYSWLERDISWSYEIYDLLSLAAYYSGRKEESLNYAVQAYLKSPKNDRLKQNVQIIEENLNK